MQKFHERFGIELGIEEGKRRFVNRVLNVLSIDVPSIAFRYHREDGWFEVERYLCSRLGERYTRTCCLKELMGADFDKCLRALEALYEYPRWKGANNPIEPIITGILHETEIDIGIRWESGQFLPAGAPALDDALVNDPLNLLNTAEYEEVAKAFQNGLNHLLHSIKNENLLANVVADMYKALEGLFKIVCGNNKGINANRDSFIKTLSLNPSYNEMLDAYIDYANLMARHASEQGQARPPLPRKEVEAFVYLTGLFIRLALSKDS